MTTVAVVGLGYVGLPLAVEFGKKYRTIGFDLSDERALAHLPSADRQALQAHGITTWRL